MPEETKNLDAIQIHGLRLYAKHGVNGYEKEKGQAFLLDVTLFADLQKACQSDALADTINYSDAVTVISHAFCRGSFDLIEAAAQHVIDELFDRFAAIEKIQLTLKKPRAPIAADFDYVSVRLVRERK